MKNRYGDKVQVNFSELGNYTQKELKRKYRLSDGDLLKQVHCHLDGASLEEKRKIIDNAFTRKGKE